MSSLGLAEREAEVYREVLAGNVPGFLRRLCPMRVTNVSRGLTNTALFYVTPDYLAVGSDADYLLMPLSPGMAQRLADALQCSLPTPKMVDAIYSAAPVKLSPAPIPPSAAMTTIAVFSNHNEMVRVQRAEQLAQHPLGALVAGHKKDVVICARLAASPGKVAIYGWHRTNGSPIQPLYLGHAASWVDYSQCVRLVSQDTIVNDRPRKVAEVLADPDLAGLLSDEGKIQCARYETNVTAGYERTTTGGGRADAKHKGDEVKLVPDKLRTDDPPGAGFQSSRWYNERIAWLQLESGVRVQVNVPGPQLAVAGKPILLVCYALPNGNTIEQTIGRKVKDGDDWHFNIQHIGAQVRWLREVLKDRTIAIAYLENSLKSWPAWRKAHGDESIPNLIQAVGKSFTGADVEIALCGHSGGGSLIFGYLNALDSVPDHVTRIAFLDANYAYEASRHRRKLASWLKAGSRHFLCVLAYNDAVALLDGKPFVSATGGTWGKSHEMQRDLAAEFSFQCATNAGFERFTALERRVQFILKENPERKILHTVQVERNGLIHALVCGTRNEEAGYQYFGPPAYSKWIQPE